MGFMLVGLLVLQVFWTYYIMKAFVEVNVSEKIASNTYEQPTNDEWSIYISIYIIASCFN